MNTYLTIGLLTVFMSVLAPIVGGFGASVNAQPQTPGSITWEYKLGGDKENFEYTSNDTSTVSNLFTSITVANLGESPDSGTTSLGETGTEAVNSIRAQVEDSVNTINNALTTLSSQAGGTTSIGEGQTAAEWSVCVWVVCGHF
jgi:hypothetical protein